MITVSYAGLFQRLVLWTDPVLLFSHDAEVYPSNPKIQINLGNAFAQRGRWLEAALAYGRAVEISPDNPDSRLKLGLAYRVLGRRHESVQQLLEAKRLGNPFADEYLR
jgi:tetratricopeptide (TPR) repeat protein